MFNHVHIHETVGAVHLETRMLAMVLLALVVACGIALILAVERIAIPLWLVILAPPLAFLQEVVLLLHVFGL